MSCSVTSTASLRRRPGPTGAAAWRPPAGCRRLGRLLPAAGSGGGCSGRGVGTPQPGEAAAFAAAAWPGGADPPAAGVRRGRAAQQRWNFFMVSSAAARWGALGGARTSSLYPNTLRRGCTAALAVRLAGCLARLSPGASSRNVDRHPLPPRRPGVRMPTAAAVLAARPRRRRHDAWCCQPSSRGALRHCARNWRTRRVLCYALGIHPLWVDQCGR